MADIECLQLRKRALARHPSAVGAPVERPVVELSEVSIGRRMDVELDDVCAGRKRSLHRRQRAFEERMLGRGSRMPEPGGRKP
jgi:hypothetical protein